MYRPIAPSVQLIDKGGLSKVRKADKQPTSEATSGGNRASKKITETGIMPPFHTV